MTAPLLLSIALMAQVAKSADTTDVPSAETLAPAVKAAAQPDYKATIQSTIDRRKAAQAKKSKARVAKRLHEEADTKSRRDQAERMAPVLAAQQRDGLRAQMEAQTLQQMSAAMMQNAATNQMRYQLQTQQAGVPQVFVPGQGFVPYAGAIAPPSAPVYGAP